MRIGGHHCVVSFQSGSRLAMRINTPSAISQIAPVGNRRAGVYGTLDAAGLVPALNGWRAAGEGLGVGSMSVAGVLRRLSANLS